MTAEEEGDVAAEEEGDVADKEVSDVAAEEILDVASNEVPDNLHDVRVEQKNRTTYLIQTMSSLKMIVM